MRGFILFFMLTVFPFGTGYLAVYKFGTLKSAFLAALGVLALLTTLVLAGSPDLTGGGLPFSSVALTVGYLLVVFMPVHGVALLVGLGAGALHRRFRSSRKATVVSIVPGGDQS